MQILFFFCRISFRYKPILITLGLIGIATWAMLLWTTSMLWSQIIQVFYAAYISCEVAYFTYIYAKVSKNHYLAVTSHTRAALLAGKFISGAVGQTLVRTQLMNIRNLNFISFGAQIAATVVAIMLPSVDSSIYFNRIDSIDPLVKSIDKKLMTKFKSAFSVISSQFRVAYSNHHVVLWSVWYACGVCGYFQVWNYAQMLWTAIDDDPDVSAAIRIKFEVKIESKSIFAHLFLRLFGMVLLTLGRHWYVLELHYSLVAYMLTSSKRKPNYWRCS